MASQPGTITIPQKDAEEPPNKLRRTVGEGPSGLASVITVIVGTGDAQETFVLHESLLRQNSDFFDNALKCEWKEAEDKTVKLPSIKPEQFAVFAKFTLTGLVFIRPTDDALEANKNDSVEDRRSSFQASFHSIIDMLDLARFLQSTQLEDVATDILMEAMRERRSELKLDVIWFDGAYISQIYGATSRHASIRKLVMDISLYGWTLPCHGDRKIDWCPSAFCRHFMKEILPYVEGKERFEDLVNPWEISQLCKYHEHTKRGEPCYKDNFRYLPKTPSPTNGLTNPPFHRFFMLTVDSPRYLGRRHIGIATSAKKDLSTTQHGEGQSEMQSKNPMKKNMKNVRRGNQELG